MPDHSVAVVVDREFGERLLPLAQRLHVWICNTPTNQKMVGEATANLPAEAAWNEVGVTTFRVGENNTPEEMVVRCVSDIDRHHPAWSQIEVYGARINNEIRAKWQDYGAEEFQETPVGFVCSRPTVEDPEYL